MNAFGKFKNCHPIIVLFNLCSVFCLAETPVLPTQEINRLPIHLQKLIQKVKIDFDLLVLRQKDFIPSEDKWLLLATSHTLSKQRVPRSVKQETQVVIFHVESNLLEDPKSLAQEDPQANYAGQVIHQSFQWLKKTQSLYALATHPWSLVAQAYLFDQVILSSTFLTKKLYGFMRHAGYTMENLQASQIPDYFLYFKSILYGYAIHSILADYLYPYMGHNHWYQRIFPFNGLFMHGNTTEVSSRIHRAFVDSKPRTILLVPMSHPQYQTTQKALLNQYEYETLPLPSFLEGTTFEDSKTEE